MSSSLPAAAQTRTRMESAWRSFLADGRLPEFVRAEIGRSWERVRHGWRVDPRLVACPSAEGASDVLARAEGEEAFRIASPLVKELAGRLAPDGHVVGYFDADGVMLAIEGNRRTRGRLADVNFAPGACWAERAAGTNGVGTALVEARPVEVFASEHFVEAFQPWTCASAPVRSRGHVIGVVDITSPWTAHHPALLTTAEAVAHAIEARLDAAAMRRDNELLFSMARDAFRARDEFLSVAAHELKTPLTPLQLKLQNLQRLLARSETCVDADRLVEALHGAGQHVHRVVRCIDDLLDASRSSEGRLRLAPERTDLGATVRAVVQRHARDLEHRACRVTIAVRREAVGHWDAARIAQVFEHLLTNAMKYAPGLIEIEVDGDHAQARLAVRDRGPGIAPEDQERIFLPFERAVSYRRIAGFGLGLHLVRRIVEAHGGSIAVESRPAAGSTFTVELPLRTTDAAAPVSARPSVAG